MTDGNLTRDQEVLLNDRFVENQIREARKRGHEDRVAGRQPQPFPPGRERLLTRTHRILYNDSFVENQIQKAYRKSYDSET